MKTLSPLATLILISLTTIMPVSGTEPPREQEIVCVQCHGAQTGRLGEPVGLWRGSIHAENNVACHDCHGGDPRDAVNAMSPARGFIGVPKEKDVPATCGRCHVGVARDYMKSAHGMTLGKGGPTCVTCHGSHLVVKATLDIINEKTCGSCHSYDRARIIKDTMLKTETRIVAMGEKIDSYKGEGVDTGRMEKSLFAVRNSFHTLFHDVDVNVVNRESARINSDLDGIQKVLDDIESVKGKRKLAGAAAVAIALAAALLFYLLRKSYD